MCVAPVLAVVLLTTLITPLVMRGAFAMKCSREIAEAAAGREAVEEFSAAAETEAED